MSELERHPTIAFFAPPLDAGLYYQKWRIWAGVARAARGRGAHLLYVAGGEAQRGPRSVLYDLVDASTVQGLVSWNGVVTPWQVEEAAAFLQRYRPLPIVNIGFLAPGIPSLVFDQSEGISAAVTHLVEVHGCRRIAFITPGPPHPGMAAGFWGYEHVLGQHGCHDPNLVAQASPGRALAGLDARGLRPGRDYEAIVCPLDSLAMQVIGELQSAGISVPEEVAVTGLHDGQEARVVTPSLTTVRLPWEQAGVQAAEMVLALMAGQPVAESTLLPLQLVVRRSCGCLDARTQAAAAGSLRQAPLPGTSQGGLFDSGPRTAPPSAQDASTHAHKGLGYDSAQDVAQDAGPADAETLRAAEPLPSAVRQRVLAAMEQAVGRAAGDVPSGWAAPLLDSFLADLTDPLPLLPQSRIRPPRALSALEELLRITAAASGSLAGWHDVVSAMRSALRPYLGWEGAAEDLWQQARLAVGQAVTRQEARRAWQMVERGEVLQELEAGLHTAAGQAEVLDIMAALLPRLGIRRCYVTLYENPAQPLAGAALVFRYEEGRRVPLPEGGLELPPRRLLPPELLLDGDPSVQEGTVTAAGTPTTASPVSATARMLSATARMLSESLPVSLVAEALYFGEGQIGVLILEADPAQGLGVGTFHETLRSQLSSALVGVRLRGEIEAARREAEEANRLKSRFLSMVSHELRTPLAQIVGLSEMARLQAGRRGASGAALARTLLDYHTRIHASAQHLDRLIRDVLDLASEQVGQLRLETEPLDLRALLTEAAAMGQRMAAERKLAWRCEVPKDLPHVMGDRARLQQVLLNLLANAAKFTQRGEIVLRAGVRDGFILVEVSDTGIGVPPVEQEAIFDEFHQAPGTASRGFGGLGLGLAVTRRLVELHGGKVGVRSTGEEGQGSTFYFTLPILLPGEESPSAGEDRRTGPVLIIETTGSSSGQALASRLEEQGFEVATFAWAAGEDLLSAVQAVAPGVVVVECDPDAEWGWQVVRVLKEAPAHREVPVLLYGLLAGQDRGDVLPLDVLGKPAGVADLTKALARYRLATEPGHPPPTILIVDDDPETLAVHEMIVRARLPRSVVLTAAGGRQALEIVRGSVPSLVLLDLLMPEVDGFAVLEALRSDPRTRHVPVVVLTGQALSEADLVRLTQGVAAVLSKGVLTTDETMARIQAVLANMPQLGEEGQRQVRRAMAYIHAHYAEPIPRGRLAEHLGLHADSLSHYFREEAGTSISTYLQRYRILQARKLLETTRQSITQVALAVGFDSHSYFTRLFEREVGVTPKAYRQGTRPTPSEG